MGWCWSRRGREASGFRSFDPSTLIEQKPFQLTSFTSTASPTIPTWMACSLSVVVS